MWDKQSLLFVSEKKKLLLEVRLIAETREGVRRRKLFGFHTQESILSL